MSQKKPEHDSELLIDGQEEVFSRTEVETGRIEHHHQEEDKETGGPVRSGSRLPQG